MGTYDWTNDANGPAWAACITVASGVTPRRLLEAMGADLSSERQATFAEADAAWTEDAKPVQVWTANGKTIAVEPNGYIASLPEALLEIGRTGEAVSVFWNVNAVMRVLVVRHGAVIREFDPLMYDDGEAPLPEEAGLAFGVEDGTPHSESLVFLERRTGFVATETEILGVKRATYLVPTPRGR